MTTDEQNAHPDLNDMGPSVHIPGGTYDTLAEICANNARLLADDARERDLYAHHAGRNTVSDVPFLLHRLRGARQQVRDLQVALVRAQDQRNEAREERDDARAQLAEARR